MDRFQRSGDKRRNSLSRVKELCIPQVIYPTDPEGLRRLNTAVNAQHARLPAGWGWIAGVCKE